MAELLKLTALDVDDLAVISAHMQDAVLKLADIRQLKSGRQFVLIANRFVWNAGLLERRRTGLHFDRVTRVRSQRIRQGASESILCLLAISFDQTDPPSGDIILTFAGGGAIALEVDCIEAQLRDLGPAWATDRQPQHDV